MAKSRSILVHALAFESMVMDHLCRLGWDWSGTFCQDSTHDLSLLTYETSGCALYTLPRLEGFITGEDNNVKDIQLQSPLSVSTSITPQPLSHVPRICSVTRTLDYPVRRRMHGHKTRTRKHRRPAIPCFKRFAHFPIPPVAVTGQCSYRLSPNNAVHCLHVSK